MFIEKLCEYSDVLKSKGLLPPDNYAYRGITALIELNLDGTVSKISNFKEIVTIKLKNGKEKKCSVLRSCFIRLSRMLIIAFLFLLSIDQRISLV